MNTKWKSPKIIIGPPATGNYYFNRPQIVDEIWVEIKKGNHILIAAPRRVGKTSIMRFIEENPKDGYKPIFKNIQSIQSEKEFYKTIYELILTTLNRISRIKTWFVNYLKSKKITEFGIDVSFKIEDVEIDFLNEIQNKIIPILEEHGETIILILDELPEVLHNLYKNGNTREASHILKVLRTWGQEPKYKQIRIITSGSVGIHHIVKLIEGRTSDINAYEKAHYEPFTTTEAVQYIQWATDGATVQYDETLINHLLDKVKYYVPFFINILLIEINKIAQNNNNPNIETQDIDKAFNHAVNNSEYFLDWKLRLKQYFPIQEYHFLMEILIYTSHHNVIAIQKIYDIAVKHQLQFDYMELMKGLENDGYLLAFENGTYYKYFSALLQEFWKRSNPILPS